MPLDQYRIIIEESIETAAQLRQKRAQYEGRNHTDVYNRNVAAYREQSRSNQQISTTGGPQQALGSLRRVPENQTRGRPYDIGQATDAARGIAVTGQRYADSESHDRNRAAAAEQSRSGPGSTVRFGARDIRYMTEAELAEDRRASGRTYSGGTWDSGRADGADGRLTGTISRRGRGGSGGGGGGLHNLGRFTKSF